MAKFMNIVRCKVKTSNREEYLKKIDEMPKFDGQLSAKYVGIVSKAITKISPTAFIAATTHKAHSTKIIE